MSPNNVTMDKIKHSDPIPIITSTRNNRARSMSVSSASSGSASSGSEILTPVSASVNSQRINIPSPSSSPILSYFLAQSPTKVPASATFPFKRKFGPPPVFEEEETDNEVPAAAHARRASATVAGRFSQPQATQLPDPQHDRGTGLLRRLSLSSSAFVKPQAEGQPRSSSPTTPPNTAVSPTQKGLPFSRDSRPRRSATISATEGARPRRAPSPMGERILKGHFDGFN